MVLPVNTLESLWRTFFIIDNQTPWQYRDNTVTTHDEQFDLTTDSVTTSMKTIVKTLCSHRDDLTHGKKWSPRK